MKKTMIKMNCLLVTLLLSISLSAQDKKQTDNIVGDWEYVVSNAPQGYEKGVMKVFLNDNKLSAEIHTDGTISKVNEVKKDASGKYTCVVYIEGSPVGVTLTKKGEGLEGYAEVDGQQLPATLKRVVAKK